MPGRLTPIALNRKARDLSPATTLGRSPVSPGFAGCHVPADRRQRIPRHAGAAGNRLARSLTSLFYQFPVGI